MSTTTIKNCFFEDTIDKDSIMDFMKLYDNADAEEVLGKEKVSGFECEKKKVTTTRKIMGASKSWGKALVRKVPKNFH